MLRAIGVCFVLIGVATIATRAFPPQRPSFSLVLERAGTVWSANCESGCDFLKVSTTTRDLAMPMRLDEHGLRTLAADYPEATRFAFTLVARGQGFEATSVKGTAWAKLAFECAQEPCRVRVTDDGVTGLASGR